jgi:hypothetical protein
MRILAMVCIGLLGLTAWAQERVWTVDADSPIVATPEKVATLGREEKIDATRVVDLSETVTLALAEAAESTDTAKLEKASEEIAPVDALEFETVYVDRVVTETRTVPVVIGIDEATGEVLVRYEERVTTATVRDQAGRMRAKLKPGVARFEDGKFYEYEKAEKADDIIKER